MNNRSFEINLRPENLGGGWALNLYEDGEEAGGGVFPVEPDIDHDQAYSDALDAGHNWIGD